MPSTAHPPYWGMTLQSGSRGPDVALIQRWLNAARRRWNVIRPVAVDGRYGSATATAVKTFQQLAGLRSDGVVGPETWDALYEAAGQQQTADDLYPGVQLQEGNQGAAVKSAQQKLQALVPALNADGEYGSRTREAVRAYQTVEGLNADGVIGPATWASLFGPG
ncbi:MAG TPA: peptidoglycan-binding protein [Candidatus Gemmiger stercorigallinarum]|nr:peptidoglycan-binding protein [Candidatus Gemmiger stercorigallinarum]